MANVSIIIIVKNDREIHDTLESLNNLKSNISYEIIVVDSSNHMLDDIKSKYPNVIWHNYKALKKTTIPEQRNEGVKLSSSENIIFLDSGSIPQQNWLEYITEPLQQHEKIIAGKVIPSNSHQVNAIQSFPQGNYLTEAATVNMLIHMSVFKKIGYFDTNFQCGEDVDFCWRAKDNDFKIFYEPKAIVTHDYGGFYPSMKRAFRYGSARIALYKKHHEKIKYIYKRNVDVLVFPLLFILLPLSFYYPVALIPFLVIFIKNINDHPFSKLSIYFSFGLGVIYVLMISLQKK